MADLSQTAANVLKSSGSIQNGTAGATITAGMPIYLDADDSNHAKPAEAGDTAAKAAAVAIALNGASDGQPVSYLAAGSINLGATLTVGTVYVVSQTAGKICPNADLVSGDMVTVLGIATTTALLSLDINASGIEVP